MSPEWYRAGFAGVAIFVGLCSAYGSAARRYAPSEAAAPRWIYRRSFGAAAPPKALARINRAYRVRYDAERIAFIPEIIAFAVVVVLGALSLLPTLPLPVLVASSIGVLAGVSLVSYLIRGAAPRRRLAVLQGPDRQSPWQLLVFVATLYCGIFVAVEPQLDLGVRIAASITVGVLVLLAWRTRTGKPVLAGDDMDAASIVDRRLRFDRSQGLLVGALVVTGVALFFGSADAGAGLSHVGWLWSALRDIVPMAILIYCVPYLDFKPVNVELSSLE